MAMGNATVMPAIAMAAEKRILAALKIKPPSNALIIFDELACCRSVIKLLPSLPTLPNVSADRREKRRMPMT